MTETMNIYATKGHKVKVTEETAKNGYPADAEKVKDLIGRTLTVDNTDVGSSHTYVSFLELPGQRFNSVNFEDLEPKDDECVIPAYIPSLPEAIRGLDVISGACYANAEKKGFWKKYQTIKGILHSIDTAGGVNEGLEEDYQHSFFAQRLALIHSEVSEALEGDRKNLMDDKLPQYKMQDVELADAVIRIFDLAGGMNIPLGEIVAAKMGYNSTRPYMHGKAY